MPDPVTPDPKLPPIKTQKVVEGNEKKKPKKAKKKDPKQD